jgi:hypothetical protein
LGSFVTTCCPIAPRHKNNAANALKIILFIVV